MPRAKHLSTMMVFQTYIRKLNCPQVPLASIYIDLTLSLFARPPLCCHCHCSISICAVGQLSARSDDIDKATDDIHQAAPPIVKHAAVAKLSEHVFAYREAFKKSWGCPENHHANFLFFGPAIFWALALYLLQ